MVKSEADVMMEGTTTAHFSGLHFEDEYPVQQHTGQNKVPVVIGVAGGTASGKTTVCDMIIQQLHDHRVVLVNQDSFYRGLTPKELANVGEYNFDHPGKMHLIRSSCWSVWRSSKPIYQSKYPYMISSAINVVLTSPGRSMHLMLSSWRGYWSSMMPGCGN
jgi:hypothetical protein